MIEGVGEHFHRRIRVRAPVVLFGSASHIGRPITWLDFEFAGGSHLQWVLHHYLIGSSKDVSHRCHHVLRSLL